MQINIIYVLNFLNVRQAFIYFCLEFILELNAMYYETQCINI